MSKGLLIAGNESALLSAIEDEAARRLDRYVCAVIPNRFTGFSARPQRENSPAEAPSVPGADALPEKPGIPLDWNPGSPISARTLILAAENRLGQLDGAILVCDPPSAGLAAADLSLADIEVMARDQVKGWFLLARELAAAFKARGGGTLALAYPETGGKEDAGDLLGSAALASFRSLTRSLLAASSSEPYLVQGFAGGETGDEAGFAAFIFKQLEDASRRTSGKLHKYGKLGFFK